MARELADAHGDKTSSDVRTGSNPPSVLGEPQPVKTSLWDSLEPDGGLSLIAEAERRLHPFTKGLSRSDHVIMLSLFGDLAMHFKAKLGLILTSHRLIKIFFILMQY